MSTIVINKCKKTDCKWFSDKLKTNYCCCLPVSWTKDCFKDNTEHYEKRIKIC